MRGVFEVNPARAGMIRLVVLTDNLANSKPRASGDDPEKMISDLKGKK